MMLARINTLHRQQMIGYALLVFWGMANWNGTSQTASQNRATIVAPLRNVSRQMPAMLQSCVADRLLRLVAEQQEL